MNFRPRRRHEGPSLSVVSMADIAFLLIIFLMLIAGMTREPRLQVDLPQAHGEQVSKRLEAVTVGVARDGSLTVDGRPTTADKLADDLRPRLAALRHPALVVASDEGVAFGAVVQVMDTARSLGVIQLDISVEEPRP